MTENACQTSLQNDQSRALEELKKLKEENFILQGKIRGYSTLGNLLLEQKEECAKLKKMNEELWKHIPSTRAGNFSQNSGSDKGHVMNGATGITNKNPGEDKPQSICSENIDVSLKTVPISNGSTDPLIQEQTNLNSNRRETSKAASSWTDQMVGMSYPPNDLFQQIKTDKFPTQESISMNSESDIQTEMTNLQTIPNLISNGIDSNSKQDCKNVLRSSSTIVNIGSDTKSDKSLNLMEFPSTRSEESSGKISNLTTHSGESSGKVSNLSSKVVTSSQSSSIQVIKPGMSRQGSKSDTALSFHVQNVTELMNGDLGTDGPASKMKKMLEDILPDLTKIEQENENLKIENMRVVEENHRLLRKVQQLELQLNNLSPAESLSSQTQVVGWDYVTKAEVQKSKLNVEKMEIKTTDPMTRMKKLEHQNAELLQANTRWEKMFKEMRGDQENRARQHQMQIEALRGQLTKKDLEDEKCRCEYDRILLSTKNRLEDEETAREALQAQLTEYQLSYEQLQREKRELDESFTSINREHLVREAELNVLRQEIAGNSLQPQHMSSESELRTEIAVLREQLTVFQEDFDRERSDRAKAQSEKDDLNKQLLKLRTENHTILDQNKRYLPQLQTAEVNVKEAIEESTRLNSTNIELRNKVRQLESQLSLRPSPFSPNIPSAVPQAPVMVQPETDPYARPSPPYLFHQPALNPGNLPTNRERYPSEQQPGAWNCDVCTFSNHPSRVVCEMCGKIRIQGNTTTVQNPSPTLWRRGENGEQNDLASDCGR